MVTLVLKLGRYYMPSDQRSVTAQLADLIVLANRNGLYDAADWVQTRLAEFQVRKPVLIIQEDPK